MDCLLSAEGSADGPCPREGPTRGATPPVPVRPGGSRELLRIALPLVVSQGFMTVQVLVDTVLLARHDPREMAASFPAVMWFWLPFGPIQVAAGYVSTFVAQYTGAGRPRRGGAGGWAGVFFSRGGGGLFPWWGPGGPGPGPPR